MLRSIVTCLLALLASCSDDRGAPGEPAPTLFRDIAADVGLDVVHVVDFSGDYRLPEIMGSGAAVFDADGDGHADVYVVNAGRTKGDGAPNRLFLRRGDHYVEAKDSGLEDRGYGMGACVADVDNDGDVDVFVANWGRDALYLNGGGGRFAPARRSGITAELWSTSCAFLDYDVDGLLDLWVCAYVEFVPSRECYAAGGSRDYCGPKSFKGARDILYRNLGGGRFSDVSKRVGVDAPAAGLGIIADHFDDDGRIDVYVANDQESNHLWMGRDGRFADEALAQGVAVNGMGAAESSMGVACGDVDGDGLDDLFITHLDTETNTLYERLPGGGFRDATTHMRLAEPSLGMTGFGAVFFDLENDGDLDVAAANGRVAMGAGNIGAGRSVVEIYGEPNQLFSNDGKGVFSDRSREAFGALAEISRGLVPFDHDGDGDLDLLVTNCTGPLRLYENVAAAGHWIDVEPWDRDLKRAALGARVVVRAADGMRAATCSSTASYLSSWLLPMHFGLGSAEAVDSIEVRWPGGERETFPGGAADRVVRLVRGQGKP